jgi:GMP synthase-like glutamine amidotransferase
VITGSPASANGSESWVMRLLDFIREVDARKVPTVGVCFGHQAIARALGGTVSKNPGGWGFGIAETRFTEVQPWMTPWHETLSLYAAHNEQVTQPPSRAVVLGGSAFCPVGSYRIGTHIFTTEYHPEMTPAFISALSHEIEDYVGVENCIAAREQLKAEAQGPVFAQWMVNFLKMPRQDHKA